MLPPLPDKVIPRPNYRGIADFPSSRAAPASAESYPSWSCREAVRAFHHYRRRFEKLKDKLERKLAAGTFRQLPAGTRRKLIHRYRRLKAKLEKLRLRLLKLGGLAALSLAFASSQAHAAVPNPLNLSDLATGNGSVGFVLNGVEADDKSGSAVSSAGDINGDGFDDLIVGAASADPGDRNLAGTSYVVFGQAEGFAPSLELSSLDGSNGFVLNGLEAYDNLGFAVSGAGDVNGDGFDDLIIGAPSSNPGSKINAGASYVVFGQAGSFAPSLELSSLNGSTGFVLNGAAAGDVSGSSVSSAGDVNGDGFDDLIIGAPFAGPGGNSSAGTSYVVFGKAEGFAPNLELSSLNGSNGFVLNGIEEDDESGNSVSNAGDVNGDGFGDIIIGAPYANNGKGESYVIFGQENNFSSRFELSGLDGSNGFKIRANSDYDYSGYSVSNAGDVNGDGFDDLIIGAIGKNNYAGASYLVFGKASTFDAVLELSNLNGDNGFVLKGVDAYDFSGSSVSRAGDVNGDGFDDLIIGAPFANFGGKSTVGESYVVFGKETSFGTSLELSNLSGSNGFVLNGIDMGDFSGNSVSHAGDVNGDGFDDLIIGADFADPNSKDEAGESYVIFGGNFTGGVETQVGDIGDNELNGSWDDDVLIGGRGNDTLVGLGGADVLRGGEGDDVLAISDRNFRRLVGGNGMDTLRLDGNGLTLDLTAIPDNQTSGIEVIDIRGDGANSLILDPQTVLNLSDESNTVMVLATADDTVEIGDGWFFAGLDSIGGRMFSTYTQGAARLMVAGQVQLSGLPIGDGSAGFVLNGIDSDDRLGDSVSSAGDVNGDGFDDIIIGAPSVSYEINDFIKYPGESYVVFGQANGFGANPDLSSLDGNNGFALRGISDNEHSGRLVNSVGDLNGDGFDDITVVAWGDFDNSNDTGDGYVVFGKTDGFEALLALDELDGNNGFVIDEVFTLGQSNLSVSSAGDINRDGFDDLIVGAWAVSRYGKRNVGESYVVFGYAGNYSPNLDLANLNGSDGFKIRGIDAFDGSGGSVSNAGDLNGDGFDDIIIGASNADPGDKYNAGECYVVFGKEDGFGDSLELSSLDGNNGFVIKGIDHFDYAGGSVSGARDVNGDGFDDIIISAFGASNFTGECYVIFGQADGFGASLALSSLNGSNGFVLNGIDEGDFSGSSVSGAGDVNGDGFDDVIIGAFYADPGGNYNAGESYVVFGKADGFGLNLELSSLDGSNGFVLKGIAEDDFSGRSVSGAGDVNGDGFDDLIIGALNATPSGERVQAGETYVIYGGNFTGAVETVSVLTIGLNAEGAYEMQFVGLTGVEYVVEYSTDLETWTALTTVTGSANSKLIVDAEAAGQPERFYRVRALSEEPDQ